MDKIIGYSDDDLLVKILSFLPTKVAVSTSVLSKHWKFLWMRVTKLDFDEDDSSKVERMRRFIARNLPLHPVVESLRLDLSSKLFQPEDIKLWVEIAVSPCMRELSITSFNDVILPSSLYTCNSLVTLKLINGVLVDVPRVVCLPSLKTLHLQYVKYADEESLQRLLSNCFILEDLVVTLWDHDNVKKFAVSIPSLLSFEICGSCNCDGYVIDTPFLKYFKASEFSMSSSFLIADMPKLERADIDFDGFTDIKKLLEPVTSVKRLSLYSRDNNAELVDGGDIVFHELEHLDLYISNTYWSKLLLWFLKSSPKLRDFHFHGYFSQNGM